MAAPVPGFRILLPVCIPEAVRCLMFASAQPPEFLQSFKNPKTQGSYKLSNTTVNGPSFNSSTFISAPNLPFCTG